MAIRGESFDEAATVNDFFFYQCALIHGNTPFSMDSYRSLASNSVLPT